MHYHKCRVEYLDWGGLVPHSNQFSALLQDEIALSYVASIFRKEVKNVESDQQCQTSHMCRTPYCYNSEHCWD